MKLTNTHIKAAKSRSSAYKMAEGGGMCLLVKKNGHKYWQLDYRSPPATNSKLLLVLVMHLKLDSVWGKTIWNRHCSGSRFTFVDTSVGIAKNLHAIIYYKVVGYQFFSIPVLLHLPARVAEWVDARDLKSLACKRRAGSTPAPGTN